MTCNIILKIKMKYFKRSCKSIMTAIYHYLQPCEVVSFQNFWGIENQFSNYWSYVSLYFTKMFTFLADFGLCISVFHKNVDFSARFQALYLCISVQVSQ